jgi:hypothetical protein
MVTVDDLKAAIGKPMQSAEVQSLINKLGPGTRKKDDLGIYYRYKTSGVILVENESRLAEIYLEPKGRGMSQYEGEIPFGVRFGQSREEIRALLGEPTKAVATIADEFDQGLWTFRVDYTDVGSVESITLKAE